jgi:hypothetical protein
MHESVCAFLQSLAVRIPRVSFVASIAVILLIAGCRGMKSAHCNCKSCGHAQQCDCQKSCGKQHKCCKCGKQNCICGHMQALYRVPCEKCGCLLHYCEHSGYVGPVEPPPPPRFHPVPTHPVLAEGFAPLE